MKLGVFFVKVKCCYCCFCCCLNTATSLIRTHMARISLIFAHISCFYPTNVIHIVTHPLWWHRIASWFLLIILFYTFIIRISFHSYNFANSTKKLECWQSANQLNLIIKTTSRKWFIMPFRPHWVICTRTTVSGICILWDGTSFNSSCSKWEMAQTVAIRLCQTVTLAAG